jgi:glycosyltransferase involved in cell wall biosynthesis
MKIIYVTARLPYGADEAFVIPELRELIRRGHRLLVVPRSPIGRMHHGHELVRHSRSEKLFSARVLKAAVAATLAMPGAPIAAQRALRGGASASLFAKNLAVIPKALWLADVAIRWGADHIHCHWAGTTATMAMVASQVSGIPWSLTAHRWDIVENNLLARKVKAASFARFISEDGLEMARSLGVGRSANARVLYMGVAVPPTVKRRLAAKPIVLCPARLVQVKGHRYLLEAWRILQSRGVDGELWLAGDGSLKNELEALSQSLHVERTVRFLGIVEHSELLRMYAESAVSVVVLASVDLGNGNHEGIPVGLIEAMSYGIPVVATRTGGTAELVVSGTGLLVAPADSAGLADAIESLLLNRERSEQLGSAGRRRVEESFNIARVAAALETEFKLATQTAAAPDVSPQLNLIYK